MKIMIKISGCFTILFAVVFVFNLNISAQTKTEFLIVADKTAKCASDGATAGNCLQVKRINEEKFTVLNENIENFQYIPGSFYLLEVSFSPVGASSADPSKFKYQLEKILRRVNSEIAPLSFSETVWKLTQIEGGAVKSEEAYIKFDEQRDVLEGNGGCNGFTGKLTKNGNRITLPEIFSTKKFCALVSVSELKFFSKLDVVTRYEIVGKKLKLFAGDSVVLEFEAKK